MTTTATAIELHTIRGEPEIGPSIPATPSTLSRANSAHFEAPGNTIGGGDGDQADERGTAVLPPVDRGRDAWQFLIAATLIETTVWGIPYTVGVLHQYWATQMFPEDESVLTLAATLQTGLMYISTAFFGPLFTAFPRQRQWIQVAGLVISTVGMIAAGFAKSAGHLVVTMGCLYPFAGALYLPCATLIYEWFQARRGLATGIMFAGTGIGGTVFPLIVSGLLKRVGYKATMVSLGIALAIINGIALMFIKRRVPIPRRRADYSAQTKIDWAITLTPAFWCGILVLFLTSLGNFNPTLWIPTFAETVNATRPDGTALVAIMNAASVPGNTLMGWISDRYPSHLTISISCLLSTISVLVLWGLGTSSALLIVFSIVWGITALSFVSLWSKMIRRICKDDPTMSVLVFSTFAVLRGVGNLTSGPISTLLLKTGHFRGAAGGYGKTNFGAVLVYTAVTLAAGGFVGVFFPK